MAMAVVVCGSTLATTCHHSSGCIGEVAVLLVGLVRRVLPGNAGVGWCRRRPTLSLNLAFLVRCLCLIVHRIIVLWAVVPGWHAMVNPHTVIISACTPHPDGHDAAVISARVLTQAVRFRMEYRVLYMRFQTELDDGKENARIIGLKHAALPPTEETLKDEHNPRGNRQ